MSPRLVQPEAAGEWFARRPGLIRVREVCGGRAGVHASVLTC